MTESGSQTFENASDDDHLENEDYIGNIKDGGGSIEIPEEALDVLNMLQKNKILESCSFDYEGEIGGDGILDPPDVDITLYPSRNIPVAGELWSISGEIFNRSTKPIWIVDRRTILTLAPEMWGQTSQAGSMGAFFPTTKGRQEDELVRVDPGAKYTVIWKVNTIDDRGRDPNSFKQVFRSIICAIRDFTFFNPGEFLISSTVHVWSTPPKYDENGVVTNTGDSFPISVTKNIIMEASPWVLILGAMTGGILCFLLQLLYGLVNIDGGAWDLTKTILVGLGSSTILCGVGTVLISRLAKTDFLLTVTVKDIWGAIATGFIIQWFGYEALTKLIPNI